MTIAAAPFPRGDPVAQPLIPRVSTRFWMGGDLWGRDAMQVRRIRGRFGDLLGEGEGERVREYGEVRWRRQMEKGTRNTNTHARTRAGVGAWRHRLLWLPFLISATAGIKIKIKIRPFVSEFHHHHHQSAHLPLPLQYVHS